MDGFVGLIRARLVASGCPTESIINTSNKVGMRDPPSRRNRPTNPVRPQSQAIA